MANGNIKDHGFGPDGLLILPGSKNASRDQTDSGAQQTEQYPSIRRLVATIAALSSRHSSEMKVAIEMPGFGNTQVRAELRGTACRAYGKTITEALAALDCDCANTLESLERNVP